MSQSFEKLKTLLLELFQLDQPDLDFGLYRIMHAKTAEITQFLDKDLLPQVKAAFAEYQTADRAAIEKELAELTASLQRAGVDPEQAPKVRELRARLAKEGSALEALEAEVYDHLYSFFRRYYAEGDFLSKRVYKPGVYAIPYEGEEVKLYWANYDQYYIKTSECLRDYAFRLRPDDDADPMRVHFRLVDAAEGEHGNVKENEGKQRVFILRAQDFIAEEEGEAGKELVIRFEYRPATLADWGEQLGGRDRPPAQKDLVALAEARILAVQDAALARWIDALRQPHVKADGSAADYSRLRAHLNRYTARNTFDYFIHKDLGAFLRRELDFYIKNEVMHLDDVENETAPRVEQYLSMIKVIRRIANKIIDFLVQLEDFQKKLWLKKKFVVETEWCIRVGCIPEEFYPEIAANDAQREEWVRLCAIDEIAGDLVTPGYSVPLTPEFLKAHPSLVVDTRHFGPDFTARLLAAIADLDEQTDGVLFHSENFQALALMQTRYREVLKCVYLDPPYNTGGDGFLYKDAYQHSSWISMMCNRLELVRTLLDLQGLLFIHIDNTEQARLRLLGEHVFGPDRFHTMIAWKNKYGPGAATRGIGDLHEYVLVFTNDPVCTLSAPLDEESIAQYSGRDSKFAIRGGFVTQPLATKSKDPRPNLVYPVIYDGQEIWPNRQWIWSRERLEAAIANDEIVFNRQPDGSISVRFKQYLRDEHGKIRRGKPLSLLLGPFNQDGTAEIESLFGERAFPFPKPAVLGQRLLEIQVDQWQEPPVILDFFAGSATTGHAVINLNREDGGRRKFILVEMADYFDTVLLPRLKKVIFTPEWKDGKPKRMATPEEVERSPRIMKVLRLESYEDTLNNLETRRTAAQQSLLAAPEAQGPDGFKEQYTLRYMLDVETRGSQSLLNITAFTDPASYRLRVKRPGSDESREVTVDLLETLNWLIGLRVQRIAAPENFSAQFERDSEGRLCLNGQLRPDVGGRWWFRAVTGLMPDGKRALIIWRNRPGGETPEGIEQDNLVLDEWFTLQGYLGRGNRLDVVYVNGDNNLENLKAAGDTWNVRLIEEDFHRLMFETEGV